MVYNRSASLSSASNNGVAQNGADSDNVGAVAQGATNKPNKSSDISNISHNKLNSKVACENKGKKERLIYSNQAIGVATVPNVSAVSNQLANNVGAKHDRLPTSDKSIVLVD